MMRVFSLLLSITILIGTAYSRPQQVDDFLKSKYKNPVISENYSDSADGIPGIKIFSVYEKEYANEDPLIPDSWIYTGKNIVPGSRILDALKETGFEPADKNQAERCAGIILSLYNVYLNSETIDVKKKNKQFIVLIKGKCSDSHPFFRKNDERKCSFRITLGNKEYKFSSE